MPSTPTASDPTNRLGLVLCELRSRDEDPVSFATQALEAGVTETTIRNIVSGKRPSLTTALGLAEMLSGHLSKEQTVTHILALFNSPFRGKRKRVRSYWDQT